MTVFERHPELLRGVLALLEPDIACFGLHIGDKWGEFASTLAAAVRGDE